MVGSGSSMAPSDVQSSMTEIPDSPVRRSAPRRPRMSAVAVGGGARARKGGEGRIRTNVSSGEAFGGPLRSGEWDPSGKSESASNPADWSL